MQGVNGRSADRLGFVEGYQELRTALRAGVYTIENRIRFHRFVMFRVQGTGPVVHMKQVVIFSVDNESVYPAIGGCMRMKGRIAQFTDDVEMKINFYIRYPVASRFARDSEK